MSSVPLRVCLFLAFAASLSGCTTDLTQRPGSRDRCELHDTAMTPEIIRISSGQEVYMPRYMDIVRHEFPNHGRTRLSGEHTLVLFAANVRDHVCPDCTKAYDEYWEMHDWNGDARRPPRLKYRADEQVQMMRSD